MTGLSYLRLIGSNVVDLQQSTIAVRALTFVLSCFLAVGCSPLPRKTSSEYMTVPDQNSVVNAKAQKLNEKGKLALQENDLEKAEKLFGEALKIDVNYGAAHNNLGQVYLARKQLYLAAWEFEFARNLMPDRPEVELNLGLVYETANRLRQAESHYLSVLESDPQNPQALASLARVSVKLDDDPVRINELLNEVLMSNVSPEWVCWARDLLATKYASGDGIANVATEGLQPPINDRLSPPLRFPANSAEELPAPLTQPPAVVPPPIKAGEAGEGDSSKIIWALPPEFSSNFSGSRRLPVKTFESIPPANWSTFPQVPDVQQASFNEIAPQQQMPSKRTNE